MSSITKVSCFRTELKRCSSMFTWCQDLGVLITVTRRCDDDVDNIVWGRQTEGRRSAWCLHGDFQAVHTSVKPRRVHAWRSRPRSSRLIDDTRRRNHLARTTARVAKRGSRIRWLEYTANWGQLNGMKKLMLARKFFGGLPSPQTIHAVFTDFQLLTLISILQKDGEKFIQRRLSCDSKVIRFVNR